MMRKKLAAVLSAVMLITSVSPYAGTVYAEEMVTTEGSDAVEVSVSEEAPVQEASAPEEAPVQEAAVPEETPVQEEALVQGEDVILEEGAVSDLYQEEPGESVLSGTSEDIESEPSELDSDQILMDWGLLEDENGQTLDAAPEVESTVAFDEAKTVMAGEWEPIAVEYEKWAKKGDTVTLEVGFTGEVPEGATYNWYGPFEQNNLGVAGLSKEIEIKDDSCFGPYRCEVLVGEEKKNCYFYVKRDYGLQVEQKNQKVDVIFNNTVTLNPGVIAPEGVGLTYSWRTYEEEKWKDLGQAPTYTIKKATRTQYYCCTVTPENDSMGNIDVDFNVTIDYDFKVNGEKQPYYIYEMPETIVGYGAQVTLELPNVTAADGVELNYKWHTLDEELEGGPDYTKYSIDSVTEDQYYYCKIAPIDDPDRGIEIQFYVEIDYDGMLEIAEDYYDLGNCTYGQEFPCKVDASTNTGNSLYYV